ncbi:hypothetical protein [Fischerella thermalis]|nr:hypothetical protein [Fischerella thermalis]
MGDRCAYGGWEEVLKIEHRCTPIHTDGRSLCVILEFSTIGD